MTRDVEFAVPTLEGNETELLELLDRRIRACQKLKQYVRAARGMPVTQRRVREWRRQAKVDAMSESCVRICRRLYGRLLQGKM